MGKHQQYRLVYEASVMDKSITDMETNKTKRKQQQIKKHASTEGEIQVKFMDFWEAREAREIYTKETGSLPSSGPISVWHWKQLRRSLIRGNIRSRTWPWTAVALRAGHALCGRIQLWPEVNGICVTSCLLVLTGSRRFSTSLQRRLALPQ